MPGPRREETSFVIRLWLEGGTPSGEWRGHIVHVQSRRETYFREFGMLLRFLSQHSSANVPLKAAEDVENAGGGNRNQLRTKEQV